MMNWNHKKTLKDGEKRFKYRHLDFIVNNEFKDFFFKRTQITKFFRNYLDE
jgi:lysyl-tRNA synthetase class II